MSWSRTACYLQYDSIEKEVFWICCWMYSVLLLSARVVLVTVVMTYMLVSWHEISPVAGFITDKARFNKVSFLRSDKTDLSQWGYTLFIWRPPSLVESMLTETKMIERKWTHCSILIKTFNSLAPGKLGWNSRHVIFKQILVIDGWGISCEIALIWMSLDFTDDQSTLVQVMAWCHQATSQYISQCWPRSLSPYGVTRP